MTEETPYARGPLQKLSFLRTVQDHTIRTYSFAPFADEIFTSVVKNFGASASALGRLKPPTNKKAAPFGTAFSIRLSLQ